MFVFLAVRHSLSVMHHPASPPTPHALLLHTHFREAAVGQSDNCIPLCFHAATPALLQSGRFFLEKKQSPLKKQQQQPKKKEARSLVRWHGRARSYHPLPCFAKQRHRRTRVRSLRVFDLQAKRGRTSGAKAPLASLLRETAAVADTDWRRLSRLTVSERRFVHQ